MTEPLQSTPADATLPGRADGTRVAASSNSTLASSGKHGPPLPAAPTMKGTERYQLAVEVARGGMGVILRATDMSIKRTVAMKVALEDVAGDAVLIRLFTQEAELTGQLEHPNIVPVHDLALDEQGRPFYTMKFVHGVTLHAILIKLKDGDAATVAQYSLAQLLTIFQKVCDAVAFAHSRGVIHRDLKPANIMVGEYGEVLVMDWGLAKIVESGASRVGRPDSGSQPSTLNPPPAAGSQPSALHSQPASTLAGTVMGSPQFMSPEQAAGELDKQDARTDIFALGGVLYNILTLHPPVNGTTIPEMLQQILDGAILPPTSYNPKTGRKQAGTIKVGNKTFPRPPLIPLRHCPMGRIPDSLAAVAMKALALRREDRYQSVPELQKDIEAYQGGFATGAENASAWRQLALLVKRHKQEFALAAAALLVLVVIVAGFLVKVTHEKNRAEIEKQHAQTERDRAETERKRAEVEKSRAEVNEQRAEKTLGQLHDTAPTFYAQAQVLIEQRQWPEAKQKASFAASLAPEVADYQVLHGHLLQSSLRIAEARDAYAAALHRQPDHKLAQANLDLCEAFLRAEDGKQPYRASSLKPLQTAMLAQGRVAEAGAFARFYGQAAANRAEILAAYSNALVRAGVTIGVFSYGGVFNAHKIGILNRSFDEDLSLEAPFFTNATLAVFQGMALNVLFLHDAGKVRDFQPLRGMPLHYLELNAPVTNLSGLEGMQLLSFKIQHCPQLADLTPLRGMPLHQLTIGDSVVSNLSPLQEMPLTSLSIFRSQVSNLTPLAGIQLTELNIQQNKVSDLSPLHGMPLTRLDCNSTLVSDLSPLTGMALKYLNIWRTPVKDLSPLAGLPLAFLNANFAQIDDLTPLKGAPLRELGVSGTSITDLSPLAGMPLESLNASYAQIDDLTPLKGLPLGYLDVSGTPITDLSPLRGMPLKDLDLFECTKLQDLSPLTNCLQLTRLSLPVTCKDVEYLRSHPALKQLGYAIRIYPAQVRRHSDVTQLPTVAEFWKSYDAAKTNAPAAKPTNP